MPTVSIFLPWMVVILVVRVKIIWKPGNRKKR